MKRAALLIVALTSVGCARQLGLLDVFGHNAAALFGRVRRLPHRVTHPARADARLAVLWVGHATMLVQIDDRFVLTDPVFTSAVGQLSPRLVEPGLDPANLPHLDAVLVSHTHFDHLSPDSLEMIASRTAQYIVPDGAMAYVPDVDVPATELPTWTYWEDRGLRVTAVPVDHSGWRYGADGAWMTHGFTGYVIEYHGLTVYFGGDTAAAPALFAATAERFPRIDLALLPIAPIEPRAFMGPHHMDPTEALAAFRALGAARMVPMHFDTFINSTDAVGEAAAVLRRAMEREGVGAERVAILAVGEQRVLIGR